MNVAQSFSKIAVGLDCLGNRRLERRAVASTRKRGYGVFDAGTALIRYRTAGRGQPIVFAADPPVVLEQYDELVRELAFDHAVTIIELPGFGFSAARSGFDFSVSAVTRVVTSFLDTLGSAPFVLAFPCATAYSAVAIANDRPDLVSAVVLAQAPSWSEELAWKARRDPKGILSTPFLGQLALRARRRTRSPDWFKAAAGSLRRCHQFIETTDAAFDNGATFSLASAFQRFLVGAPALAPVQVPALFVWGLADRTHRRTDRLSSRTLARDAHIIEAPELGHFPELEDPQWFGRSVRAFLDGTIRTGSTT
jgi:pimeloyl-ACP methyl ester carboxylesterase